MCVVGVPEMMDERGRLSDSTSEEQSIHSYTSESFDDNSEWSPHSTPSASCNHRRITQRKIHIQGFIFRCHQQIKTAAHEKALAHSAPSLQSINILKAEKAANRTEGRCHKSGINAANSLQTHQKLMDPSKVNEK